MCEITPPCYVMNICILYRLYSNNMIFLRKSLLDTLVQIFIMLWHLVAEISRFKFDDYRVSRTEASDLKLFLGGVYFLCEKKTYFNFFNNYILIFYNSQTSVKSYMLINSRFNSLWPSDAIWRQKSGSALTQVVPDDNKPLPEPMFSFH